MAKNYTRFTDVEITGDLKVGGNVTVAGIDDVDAAVETTNTNPTKAEFNALVGVVNALRAALGASSD